MNTNNLNKENIDEEDLEEQEYDEQEEIEELLKTKAEKKILYNRKKRLELHLKRMSNQIVQVRIRPNHDTKPLQSPIDYLGYLFKISLSSYTFEKGVDLKGDDCIC